MSGSRVISQHEPSHKRPRLLSADDEWADQSVFDFGGGSGSDSDEPAQMDFGDMEDASDDDWDSDQEDYEGGGDLRAISPPRHLPAPIQEPQVPAATDMQKLHRSRYESGYSQRWLDSFDLETREGQATLIDLKNYALGLGVDKNLASHFQIYKSASGRIGARYYSIPPSHWWQVRNLVMHQSRINEPINLNEFAVMPSHGPRLCKFYLDIEGSDEAFADAYEPGYNGPVEPFLPDILRQVRSYFRLRPKTLVLVFMRPKPRPKLSFHIIIPSLQVRVGQIASFLNGRVFTRKVGRVAVPLEPPGLHVDRGAVDGKLSMPLTASYKPGADRTSCLFFVTSCDLTAKRVDLPAEMQSQRGLLEAASIMPRVSEQAVPIPVDDEPPTAPNYEPGIEEFNMSVWQKRPDPKGGESEVLAAVFGADDTGDPSRATHVQLCDAIIRRHGTDNTSYTYQVQRADDVRNGFPNGTFHRLTSANTIANFTEAVRVGRVLYGLTEMQIAMSPQQWSRFMMAIAEYHEQVSKPNGLSLTGVSYTGFLDPSHLKGPARQRFEGQDIYVTATTVIVRRVVDGHVVSAEDVGANEAGVVYVPHVGEVSQSKIPQVVWSEAPDRMTLREGFDKFARAVLRRGTPGHEMMGYNEVPAVLSIAGANMSLWAPMHRDELGMIPVPMLTGPPGRFKTKVTHFICNVFGIDTQESVSQSGMFAGASLQRGTPVIIDDPKLSETKANDLFHDLHQAANGGERLTRAASHRFYAGLMLVMNQMPSDIDEATKTRTVMIYYNETPANSIQLDAFDPQPWQDLKPRLREGFSDLFRVSPVPYMEAAKAYMAMLPPSVNERTALMAQVVYAHALALAVVFYGEGTPRHAAFLSALAHYIKTQSTYKTVSPWQRLLASISATYGEQRSRFGPWNCVVRRVFGEAFLCISPEVFTDLDKDPAFANTAFNSVAERLFEECPTAFDVSPGDLPTPNARAKMVKSRAFWETLDTDVRRPALDLRYVRGTANTGLCNRRVFRIGLSQLRVHFQTAGVPFASMGVLGGIVCGEVSLVEHPPHYDE